DGGKRGGDDAAGKWRGLGAIGAWCARRHLVAIAVWVGLLAVAIVADHAAGGTFSDNDQLSGTQSSDGLHLLSVHEPTAGGHAGQIVMHVDSGGLSDEKSAIESSLAAVRLLPHVL